MGIEKYNPAAILIYFLCVTLVAMFCRNPVLILISLGGAAALFLCRDGGGGVRTHAAFFGLFIIMALINPLFSHNGATVLFVVNNNPVTAEALIYGVFSSALIIAVLYWFRSFSLIMTSDRLLYVFGAASPKLALILSMALRYIPLFKKQATRTLRTQRALGLYTDNNIIDTARGSGRVLSVMVTWALENGIITADSMSARGYASGKRSSFSLYRFGKRDAAFVLSVLVLFAVPFATALTGLLEVRWYPIVQPPPASAAVLTAYVCYALLAFLPAVIETGEDIKWKYLRSKI
ncbi:MAG: energy-coupling factor transporter transmembrane protein EcfT [Clostridiales bacterium]|nr:energy-coupling factor transporter transmembrane protein EcfT [Clostridiales bacterium]